MLELRRDDLQLFLIHYSFFVSVLYCYILTILNLKSTPKMTPNSTPKKTPDSTPCFTTCHYFVSWSTAGLIRTFSNSIDLQWHNTSLVVIISCTKNIYCFFINNFKAKNNNKLWKLHIRCVGGHKNVVAYKQNNIAIIACNVRSTFPVLVLKLCFDLAASQTTILSCRMGYWEF